MIDLHLHTTASDGLFTPGELVQQAAAAGVTTLAVTDHDTTAATADVAAHCRAAGLNAIAGIEVTAVERGRDAHVLGYFIRPYDPALGSFLMQQREARVVRVRAIAERLAGLGAPVDVEPLIADAQGGKDRSIGRPQVARALVDAGHVRDINEAFESWLAVGRPGFVPRAGAPPEKVIAVIHGAGGVASLAHPGLMRLDDRIPALVEAGLDAIEVYHPDHDAEMTSRYAALARRLGLLVTGGSDFHGDPAHGGSPGMVTLPAEEWARLLGSRV